jgi:hypothetical protein
MKCFDLVYLVLIFDYIKIHFNNSIKHIQKENYLPNKKILNKKTKKKTKEKKKTYNSLK